MDQGHHTARSSVAGLAACYPGSFDPPTVAHVAVIEAVLGRPGIARVDIVLSADPLGKPGVSPVADRVEAMAAVTVHLAGATVTWTDLRLLADVAAGYDVLVLGADKWAQVHEVGWYGSVAARDDAVRRLPTVLVVPRAGVIVPPGVEVLVLDPAHAAVSSTAVRAGRHGWRARPAG